MRVCYNSLLAPLYLLTIFASTSSATDSNRWPYNLKRGEKYWPEHESLVRKQESARARFATETPIGMRKMGGDPGEMFFLHYWKFEGDVDDEDELPAPDPNHTLRKLEDESESWSNMSVALAPPLLPLTSEEFTEISYMRNLPRNVFAKRDFQCPSGTYACTSVDRPNSCCANGETCQIVSIIGGSGDVGCCANGQTCGGQIAACNSAAGYSSCPGSSNGGCCIPGYSCEGVGCVASGYTTTTELYVVTVTVTPGQTVVTTTNSPSLDPVTTVITVQQTAVTLTTVTPTPTPTPSVLTVYTTLAPAQTTVVVYPSGVVTIQSAGNCASGYQTCGSNGGGCCPNGYACPTSGSFCLPLNTATVVQSTTVVGVAPPVRPTSDDGQNTETLTTISPSLCPTGYYQCSAFYIGGCCQVDRDCDTMSCPSPVSLTIDASGATVAVPFTGSVGGTAVVSTTATNDASAAGVTSTSTTSATGLVAGQCPSGWFQCASDAASGCCPTGYSCGASCIATAGEQPSQVARVPVNIAAGRVNLIGTWLCVVAAALGIGMVLL